MGILSFLKAKPYEIQIESVGIVNGQSNQTILQSADIQGLELPHSCRVGGCAACKCKLKQGNVKTLTEAAYVLTEEELDAGYILTCQSQPKSDLVLEYETAPAHLMRTQEGRLHSIDQLSPSVYKVTINTSSTISFEAGQFIDITVPDFPNSRSYSMVNAPHQSDSHLSFFIQRIENGSVSNWLTDHRNLNKYVQLSTAKGQCTLVKTDRTKSLMFAATGSGLAPIVSILNQALKENRTQPAIIAIGANTEPDLFYLDELRSIQSRWQGEFKIVTVLSQQSNTTHSLNGYIQDHLEYLFSDKSISDSEIYICGNPNMVEAVRERCLSLGAPPQQFHIDKFVQAPLSNTAGLCVSAMR